MIVLSSDGKVAEQGTYQQLSNNPNGAFTKLMEWQMSGGDAVESTSSMNISPEPRGPPTDKEDALHDHDEQDLELVNEEGLNVGKGKETTAEEVLEKAGKQQH